MAKDLRKLFSFLRISFFLLWLILMFNLLPRKLTVILTTAFD